MKIEELTQKIYEEGVEKAKHEEEELLGQARKEAERILADARRQAQEVTEAAQQEADQAKARLAAELRLAGDQALASLKSRITDCLVDALLPEGVKSALEDTPFLQKIMLALVERWDPRSTNLDIAVVLSAENRDELAGYFARKAKQLLDRGLEISFSDEIRNGFQIRSQDGSYRISFEEEDFVSFFRAFVRERTREILFPSGEASEAGSSSGHEGR